MALVWIHPWLPYFCVDFGGGICGGVEVIGGTTICTIMLVLASVAISLISIRSYIVSVYWCWCWRPYGF